MKKIWRKSLSILLLMITVFTGIPVAASEQILENDQEQIMPASPADDFSMTKNAENLVLQGIKVWEY